MEERTLAEIREYLIIAEEEAEILESGFDDESDALEAAIELCAIRHAKITELKQDSKVLALHLLQTMTDVAKVMNKSWSVFDELFRFSGLDKDDFNNFTREIQTLFNYTKTTAKMEKSRRFLNHPLR